MKLFLALILAFSLGNIGPVAVEASACPGVDNSVYAPLASYEQLTISDSAVSLTVPQIAKLAVITVENEPVRYRDDGTDPTADVGTLVKADGSIIVCGKSLGSIRFFKDGATDATINVNYYGG